MPVQSTLPFKCKTFPAYLQNLIRSWSEALSFLVLGTEILLLTSFQITYNYHIIVDILIYK